MFLPKSPKIIKAAYSQLIWDIPNTNNKIYLTFDDGPTPEITPWTLSILKKFNIKATFFCLGKNVRNHPEIYQQILDDGHAVGNHSFLHLSGWKTGNDAYVEDFEQAAKLINSNILRPPYGRITKAQANLLKKEYKIYMWDVLSGDFDESITPEKCLNNVIKHTKEGSIIVFHDSLKASENLKYSLPKSIEQLLEKGFVFDKLD
jgi:peptidoglycan/xylan/chitin deacetylase (PgdA/CDA1 family)